MLHNDLPVLPERMKINKCTKLVCSTGNKENYVVHIRALKQALNHGLKLTKVHRIIQFDQEAWLKPYIDMNTKLRKEATNDFEKDFFKSMNNAAFGKVMENIRKHRDIKHREFWYDYINPNMEIKQGYVTWILIALLSILKLKIFIKIL